MLTEDCDYLPAYPAALYVYVPDVDASHAAALAAGCTSQEEPNDKPYGDRTAGVVDRAGGTRVGTCASRGHLLVRGSQARACAARRTSSARSPSAPPSPLREIPFRPSRMIHFFPASNPKMVAKVPDIAPTVDVLLANLEDGVPASRQGGGPRRPGRGRPRTSTPATPSSGPGSTRLDSPWGLDDLVTAVTEVGDKLDVIMIPKVEGPEDIHYVDRLLAQLEAKAGLDRAAARARHPRDGPRRGQRRGDLRAPAPHAGPVARARPTWPPTAA